MTGQSVTVDLSGPFFTRDPGLTLIMNVAKMMQGVAEEGASSARAALQQGEGARATITELHDRLSDHVVGRVYGRPSRGGRKWHLWAKIQIYNEGLTAAQGISLMAAARPDGPAPTMTTS